MEDRDLIAKVRAEHERLDEIRENLANAIEQKPDKDAAKWLDDVRTSFEHYRAHLIHRIALEEIGGFLNVVLERRPTLSSQVEHLRDGHHAMIELAGDTMTKLRQLKAGDPAAVSQARLLVHIALTEVRYHEDAETLLVSFVFTQDTGVGD